MESKEESEKVALKLNLQKTKIMVSGHITSWQIGGEKSGSSDRFYSLLVYIQLNCLQAFCSVAQQDHKLQTSFRVHAVVIQSCSGWISRSSLEAHN